MNTPSSTAGGKVQVPATSPEHQLLLQCSKARIDAQSAEAIGTLCGAPLDWDQIFIAASRHGVLGLLYHRLHETCPELVPGQAFDFLRDCSQKTAERNRYLSEELRRILKQFRAEQISALPFDGPLLVATVYGDASLRESKSLSFFVPANQGMKAKELLLAQGYRREYTWDQRRETAEWMFLRMMGLDREDGVHVWLYSELNPGGFNPALRLRSLRPAVASFSIAGENIESLSAEDLLLHICAEAAESMLSPRLLPIVDIAWLSERGTALDSRRLLQRSDFLGMRRRLAMGLLLARDLLGARVAEELGAHFLSDPEAKQLAASFSASLFSDQDIVPGTRARLFTRMRSRERMRDKATVLARFAINPTREDWSLIALPAPLYFLWKPLRILASRAGLVSSKHLAVFMPTPVEVAEEMLNIAEVGPGDTIYDLGCGDGRIVILAARQRGARGVGVDLDPDRVEEANANARKAGVEHLVKFVRQDVMEVDLSSASVVSLFLSPQANLMLRPKLQRQLPVNARVVSRSHDMGNWPPNRTKLVACDGALSRIHLWRMDGATQGKAGPASEQ